MNKGLGAGKLENLYTAMHAAMRPQGAEGARDVTVRHVEQGARLLAAPPHGVQVILQMPRGNLEGICPRVLVLAGIAAHLQVWLMTNGSHHMTLFACDPKMNVILMQVNVKQCRPKIYEWLV